MADVTNPQLVLWANQRVRPLVNKLQNILLSAQQFQTDYANQSISSQITTAGGANLMADGSDVDGRPRVSGTQIQNLKAAIDQIVTAMATTNVSGVGVPPSTILGQIKTTDGGPF